MVGMRDLNKALKKADFVQDFEARYKNKKAPIGKGAKGRCYKALYDFKKSVAKIFAKFQNFKTGVKGRKKVEKTALEGKAEVIEQLENLNKILNKGNLNENNSFIINQSKIETLKKAKLIFNILDRLEVKNSGGKADKQDAIFVKHLLEFGLVIDQEKAKLPKSKIKKSKGDEEVNYGKKIPKKTGSLKKRRGSVGSAPTGKTDFEKLKPAKSKISIKRFFGKRTKRKSGSTKKQSGGLFNNLWKGLFGSPKKK